MTTTRRGLRWAGAALLLTAALAGCSGGTSGGGDGIDIAPQIEGQLTTLGVAADPGSLSCTAGLALEVGASVRCGFTSGGQPVDLVAEATSVDGTTVALKLTTEANAVPKAVLEEEVGTRVGNALGTTVATSTCTEDLEPAPGTSVGCTVVADGTERVVRVAVESVDGGLIDYRIESA